MPPFPCRIRLQKGLLMTSKTWNDIKALTEQLENISEAGPVEDGDLISKSHRDALWHLGYIRRCSNKETGWILTRSGFGVLNTLQSFFQFLEVFDKRFPASADGYRNFASPTNAPPWTLYVQFAKGLAF